MADGDFDIDALLEGPIDQKQDRDKSQSKEVRESCCATTKTAPGCSMCVWMI